MNLLDSKSKAAGFNDSTEPSSFSGVRHFWQYMVVNSSRGCGEERKSGSSKEASGETSFWFVFVFAAYLLALAPAHLTLLLQSVGAEFNYALFYYALNVRSLLRHAPIDSYPRP